MTRLLKGISCLAVPSFVVVAAVYVSSQPKTGPSAGKNERTRMVFSHALPPLDGRTLKVTVVEVTYGPGESSPPHSHPCAVVGFVLEGALRTQVKGEAEAIYRPGETFYEAPNGVHQISANASQQDPAKFIAYFVCDHDSPLSTEPRRA